MSRRSDNAIAQDLRQTLDLLNEYLDEAWRAEIHVKIVVNRSKNHEETTTDRLSVEYRIKKNLLP